MKTTRAAWIASVACAMLVTACGGGGGSDDVDNSWLSFTPASVSAIVAPGDNILIGARSSKTITERVNIAVIDGSGILDPEGTSVVALDPLNYQAKLRIAANAPAKVHKGSLTVRMCLDDAAVCSRPYPGSPWEVPYSIEVVGGIDAPSTIRLGGEIGRDLSPRALTVALNTGTDVHTWSLSGVPDWLSVSATSGTASQTGANVELALRGGFTGTRSADLVLTSKINSGTATRTVRVEAALDTRKLLFAETGVAFAATPQTALLQRTVPLRDSFGAAVAWRASADQPWLRVTGSGSTNEQGVGALGLVADASSLAADSLHIARVTLTSEQPGIVAPETLVVGLWKGSAAMAQTIRVSTTGLTSFSSGAVSDPVRPYFYLAEGENINIYHTHTARKIGALARLPVFPVDLAISSDGSRLYVPDVPGQSVIVVDTATGQVLKKHPVPAGRKLTPMLYTRPNGTGVLVLAGTTAMLADSGELLDTKLAAERGNTYMSATPDGSRMALSGTSGEYPEVWKLDFSQSAPQKLLMSLVGGGPASAPVDVRSWLGVYDVAISADGTVLNAVSNAAGRGTQCVQWDVRAGVSLRNSLNTENARSVTVGSDGRVRCVTRNDSPTDAVSSLQTFSQDGTPLRSYLLPDRGFSPLDTVGLLRPSGDGLVEIGLGQGQIVFVPTDR